MQKFGKAAVIALIAVGVGASAPTARAATDLPLGALGAQLVPGVSAAEVADIVAGADATLAPSIIAAAISAGVSATDILVALLTRTPQPGDVTTYDLATAAAWVGEAAPTQAGALAFAGASALGAQFGPANDANDLPNLSNLARGLIAGVETALGATSPATATQVSAIAAELIPFLSEANQVALVDDMVGFTTADDVREDISEDVATGATAGGGFLAASGLRGRDTASGNPSAN